MKPIDSIEQQTIIHDLKTLIQIEALKFDYNKVSSLTKAIKIVESIDTEAENKPPQIVTPRDSALFLSGYATCEARSAKERGLYGDLTIKELADLIIRRALQP